MKFKIGNLYKLIQNDTFWLHPIFCNGRKSYEKEDCFLYVGNDKSTATKSVTLLFLDKNGKLMETFGTSLHDYLVEL